MDCKISSGSLKLIGMFALVLAITACGENDDRSEKSTDQSSKLETSVASLESDPNQSGASPSKPTVEKTPVDGSSTVETIRRKDVSADEVGVAIYPEAIRLDERTWKTGDIDDHGVQTMTKLVLFTKDNFAKVATYYRTALSPNEADIFDVDRGAKGKLMSLTTSNPDRSSTNVLLTEVKDAVQHGTQIKITRMAVLDDSIQANPAKQSETN